MMHSKQQSPAFSNEAESKRRQEAVRTIGLVPLSSSLYIGMLKEVKWFCFLTSDL